MQKQRDRDENESDLLEGGAFPGTVFLSDLIAPVWRLRWFVLGFTVLATMLALSVEYSGAKYRSEGFFQFGGPVPVHMELDLSGKGKSKERPDGIELADFKRFAVSYSNAQRFDDFIKEKKLDSMAGVAELRRTFSSVGEADKAVSPVFAEQPKGNSQVIGVQLVFDHSSPDVAQKMVGVMGQYVMDSIVYFIYQDGGQFKDREINARIAELENLILVKQRLLEEYQRKATALRKIIARNSGIASQNASQILHVTEQTAQYLPPATLLISTEVLAVNVEEAIFQVREEIKKVRLVLEYYEKVKSSLANTKSGGQVVRSLESIKASVFEAKNMQDNINKEIYNSITVENQRAANVYFDRSRFISGPTYPGKSTARLARALVIGAVFGFALAVLFALISSWWRNNRRCLND